MVDLGDNTPDFTAPLADGDVWAYASQNIPTIHRWFWRCSRAFGAPVTLASDATAGQTQL